MKQTHDVRPRVQLSKAGWHRQGVSCSTSVPWDTGTSNTQPSFWTKARSNSLVLALSLAAQKSRVRRQYKTCLRQVRPLLRGWTGAATCHRCARARLLQGLRSGLATWLGWAALTASLSLEASSPKCLTSRLSLTCRTDRVTGGTD
jgi:hypothetical protein